MYGNIPYMMPNAIGKTSLLSKINFSSLLTNTQKILNVANQAIPLYYQAKPVFKNLKSLSKISKEFNKINLDNNNNKNNKNKININNNTPNLNNSNNIPTPIFFI